MLERVRLTSVAKSRRMAALGKKGGLVGGPARARALPPARRTAIARLAARARWSRPLVSRNGQLDLATLVAHGGSSVGRVRLPRRLEAHVVRAIKVSRRDSALARMLPVFLWRMRDRLDPAELVRQAGRQGERPTLGFFLETAARLGGSAVFDEPLLRLRRSARPTRPLYFFVGSANRPWEREAADGGTPPVARAWGLRMNMPWESFASYFEKVAEL
jgi:hypothetical protein